MQINGCHRKVQNMAYESFFEGFYPSFSFLGGVYEFTE